MKTQRLLIHLIIGILFTAIITSCSSKSEKQNNDYSSSSYSHRNYESNSSNYSDDDENNEDDSEYSSSSDCKFENGTYSATVDYYNPETGYSQTYTLDVEVEDCEVVQIDFPNGGWLDSDHITPAELDEDGNCTVDGEDGKTYEIQIDN
jgi:uncharacterized membrane protein